MKWLSSIGVVVLLFSCNKKETLKVSVKNIVTGEPATNININVYEVFNVSDGVSGTKTKFFQSGETNGEGVLFLTEKFNKNRRYTVKVGKFTENVCYINTNSYTWSVGENTDLKFEYAPCAYFNMRIENVNCLNGNDKMNFRSKYFFTEWTGWSSDRNGCYFYEGPTFFEVPMGWRIYEWKVERNGVLTFHKDSIYLAPGNEYVFELSY